MKILCSGLNVVDLLVKSPSEIKIGHKNESEQIVVQGGAPAGNAACGLASLGHEVYLLGYLGDNPMSLVAKSELVKHGVREDFLFSKTEATPAIAIVQIDEKGERTVLYSMNGYIPFSPTDVDEEQLKEFDLFLVDGYDTEINLHLLKVAQKYGIKTVLDMETADEALMKEMLALSTDPILPLEAAQNLTGKENAEDCLLAGTQLTKGQLIITDGVNGSYALVNDDLVHQAAYKVKVVDTTGCGDAFHAAYASALLEGLSVKDRMQYASFFASKVAEHFGGRTYFPNKEYMEANCGLSVEH